MTTHICNALSQSLLRVLLSAIIHAHVRTGKYTQRTTSVRGARVASALLHLYAAPSQCASAHNRWQQCHFTECVRAHRTPACHASSSNSRALHNNRLLILTAISDAPFVSGNALYTLCFRRVSLRFFVYRFHTHSLLLIRYRFLCRVNIQEIVL